jgi:dolichyl-diphosphooligosaccharide--protein glycosyltransferase
MLNCLMYKLCYYRFGEVGGYGSRATGFDRARNYEIGNKEVDLTYLEEAYTSEHWIVRIYRVCCVLCAYLSLTGCRSRPRRS